MDPFGLFPVIKPELNEMIDAALAAVLVIVIYVLFSRWLYDGDES